MKWLFKTLLLLKAVCVQAACLPPERRSSRPGTGWAPWILLSAALLNTYASADSLDIKIDAAPVIIVAKADRIRTFGVGCGSPVENGSGSNLETNGASWSAHEAQRPRSGDEAESLKEANCSTLTESPAHFEVFADVVVMHVLRSTGPVPRDIKVSLKGAHSLVQKLHDDLVGKELIYYLKETHSSGNLASYLGKGEMHYALPAPHWAFEPDGVERREVVRSKVREWETGDKHIPVPYQTGHKIWLGKR